MCGVHVFRFNHWIMQYIWFVIHFQAPYFLPLLLYKVERCLSSDLKLHILYSIPKLATHKVSLLKRMKETLKKLPKTSFKPDKALKLILCT